MILRVLQRRCLKAKRPKRENRGESLRADCKKRLSLCSILALSLLLPGASWSQVPDSGIIEAAKREGGVVWYTTMNLDSAESDTVLGIKSKFLDIRRIM